METRYELDLRIGSIQVKKGQSQIEETQLNNGFLVLKTRGFSVPKIEGFAVPYTVIKLDTCQGQCKGHQISVGESGEIQKIGKK